MDVNHFDPDAKFVADRRISRRRAVTQGGGSRAAGALATAGLARPAAAQDAMPASTEEAPPVSAESGSSTGPSMLYLQTFQPGSIAPKAGVEGRYTLSLELEGAPLTKALPTFPAVMGKQQPCSLAQFDRRT